MFVTAGALHFVNTDSYLGMMPAYLPAHRPLVLVSGAAEVAGGVGLLMPRVRVAAARGLAVLLVLVFPANLDMALHAERHSIPEPLLWARLPVQGLLIWWVLRAAGPVARLRSARPDGEDAIRPPDRGGARCPRSWCAGRGRSGWRAR